MAKCQNEDTTDYMSIYCIVILVILPHQVSVGDYLGADHLCSH